MASPDPVQQMFESAKRDFEKNLPKKVKPEDLRAITNVEQLWDALDKLQAEQSKSSIRMRFLNRITPFITRLESLAGVIEVFVQAKPDVLAFVWGPIKLLLMWTRQWREGFDAIVRVAERIGDILPQFSVSQGFSNVSHIKNVVAFLFKDILDFYSATLQFFSIPRLKMVFETLWPQRLERLRAVEQSIQRHSQLLGQNITFEHIRREEEARDRLFRKFQDDEDHRASQKFEALRIAIDPRGYSERLAWLQRRTCPGTSNWLADDEDFRNWLDQSDQKPRLLWLQGIPGAGKTFLASWVANTAKTHGETLYVFSSHTHTDSTAISVMHSLLFQLASGNQDVQTVLTNSSKSDLKHSLTTTKELLTTAIRFAGGTYIVIDGLDEIEEFERKLLLTSITDILDACTDAKLKVCISSRAEHDVVKILQPKATTIRVHSKNAAGVRIYVKTRYQEWMNNSNFSAQGQKEIQSLLAPISIKAKGMFLYARIVIDNVVDLISIEDIRRELKALPADLDSVYERVLARINQLAAPMKERVKRILGWIGCSPTPLNIYELDQAVLVSGKTVDDAPTVSASLNILKLCGPIVEIVDETPRLVHFTVKEYIFDSHRNFISMRQSIRDLLDTCVTYLCYDAVGPDVDEEQLRENILQGKYRFQAFASWSWFILVRQYVRLIRDDKTHFKDLNDLLRTLFSERENVKFGVDAENTDSDSDDGLIPNPESIQPTEDSTRLRRQPWPEAPEFILQTIAFYSDHPKDLWTVHNTKRWASLDPLTVSASASKVQGLYDSLLCHGKENTQNGPFQHNDNCVCDDLRRHYGKYIYKCHFFSCLAQRSGFETDGQCKDHIVNHSRPWKCSVRSCDWSEIGFTTYGQMSEHVEKYHKVMREGIYTQPSVMEDEALYPLLYDLVMSGGFDEFFAIWPSCRQKVDQFTEAELLIAAAGQGSLLMVQLLLDWDEDLMKPRNDAVRFGALVHDAIQSGKSDLIRWVLCKATSWGSQDGRKYRDIIVAVIKSESPEALRIWRHIITSTRPYSKNINQELFEKTVLTTIHKYPDQEARMFDTWQRLGKKSLLGCHSFGRALTMVAQTTLSIEQARVLIDCQALIDYPQSTGGVGYTALQWACRKSSLEGALFARYLLLKGANAFTSFRRPVSDEEGALKIKTWLNVTWSELVRWTRYQRRLSGQKPLLDCPESLLDTNGIRERVAYELKESVREAEDRIVYQREIQAIGSRLRSRS